MLSWSIYSLIADGRSQSEIAGVTTKSGRRIVDGSANAEMKKADDRPRRVTSIRSSWRRWPEYLTSWRARRRTNVPLYWCRHSSTYVIGLEDKKAR